MMMPNAHLFRAVCLYIRNIFLKVFDIVRQFPNFATCAIWTFITILILMHFFQINIDEWGIILILLYMIIDFKICKEIFHLYMIWNQNVKDRIYIYSYNITDEVKRIFFNIHNIFISIVLCLLPFITGRDYSTEIFWMVLIFIPIFLDCAISQPNKEYLLEISNLHIGYGGALAYFKNYLEINMPLKFIERVDQFISYNGVNLQKKLFILVPFSCKVPRDLEDEENIERCKELPRNEINHAGIKNRVYNITVYYVRRSASEKGERMAVEYAQPLKAIYSLKEKRLLTQTEMKYQRQLWTETLKKFLRESDLGKFCEIVEYDDNLKRVSDVLLESYYNLYKQSV